jgi:hypothetical protein
VIQRLLFRPEARGDISRAAHRYEQERPGLGERFVAELGESGTVVMAVIHRRRNPDVWKRRI